KQAKNSDKELESELVKELESRIVEELEPEPIEYEEVVSEMQIKNSDEPSDAKPDKCDKCFRLQQNTLKQLVENAKTKIWITSSHRPIYKDDAESTLHNKRAYWKKAASGSKKITNMFPLKNVEVPKSYTENYNFTFDDTYNSSDDDNSKFTLGSLDLLLKNKSDDLAWAKDHDMHSSFTLEQTITEYLHTYKFTLKITEFVKFIKNEVIPALGIEEKTTISHTTASYWHKFLQKFAELRKRIAIYEDENLNQIILFLLLPEIVPITQDESLFYAKDGAVKAWGPEDESQLHQKLQDLSIYVSDFICESIGCLQFSEEKCAINDLLPDDEQLIYTETCVVMHAGTNYNGYCNYNAFADNALVVTRMNMKDGSKQPLLCDGQKPNSSIHIMIFTDIDSVVKPKAAGHMCMFYPKFHCELNYIELFWAETKRYSCLHCDYMFKSLQEVVLYALEFVSLTKIHQFARHYECYMSAYKLGLTGKAAVFAVKWYRSHHCVPTSVLEEFGDVNQ
ncbi:5291_t:CDS:2, partial [Cetraspora pellucida]